MMAKISFVKLKSISKNFKLEVKTFQLVLRHPKTPKLSKCLLWVAVGYALLPFDLIPDFIPVLGYLDDAIILPVLVILAYKMTPKEIIEECRQKTNQLSTA